MRPRLSAVRFRFLSLLLPLSLPLFTGCTLEPTANGLEIVPRLPYDSRPANVGAPLAWSGEAIDVDVERGNIEVIGSPSATEVTVTANATTWARNADDAGALARAFLATAKVERDRGALRVSCRVPSGSFGTALVETSQCNVRVVVPEGTRPHAVRVVARDGFVYLQRLTSAPSTAILASGIEVEATQLRGNVGVSSYWADVEVKPTPGARVYVGSASDDWYDLPTLNPTPKRGEGGEAKFGATLRLPKDFRARRVDMSSAGASVEHFAFPDVRPGAPRGAIDASAAEHVAVHANQGNATLLALDDTITGSRTTNLGAIAREPWRD